ncbi:MAG: hypothetical protein ACFFFH_12200 [Candidatus Thorarchaeota archaeon]
MHNNETPDSTEDTKKTETETTNESLTIMEILIFIGGSIIIAVIGAAVLSIFPTNLILNVTQSDAFLLVFFICFGYGFVMLIIGFSVRLLLEILASMA